MGVWPNWKRHLTLIKRLANTVRVLGSAEPASWTYKRFQVRILAPPTPKTYGECLGTVPTLLQKEQANTAPKLGSAEPATLSIHANPVRLRAFPHRLSFERAAERAYKRLAQR